MLGEKGFCFGGESHDLRYDIVLHLHHHFFSFCSALAFSLATDLCKMVSCGSYVINMCVLCALQLFNITPFTQSDEATQSYDTVEKFF